MILCLAADEHAPFDPMLPVELLSGCATVLAILNVEGHPISRDVLCRSDRDRIQALLGAPVGARRPGAPLPLEWLPAVGLAGPMVACHLLHVGPLG